MIDSMNAPRIAAAIRSGFAGKRLLVVGDLVLDRYLWGEVSRVSPEAPVPVLLHRRDAIRAGGAGNVALNATGLGLDTAVCGYVGTDSAGAELVEILRQAGVDVSGIVSVNDRPTISKTRFIAGHQQVLRVDAEQTGAASAPDARALMAKVNTQLADGVDGVVLSDYAKGTLVDDVCQEIVSAARDLDIPVFVDPKGNDYGRYRGASVLTPNLKELTSAIHREGKGPDELIAAGRDLVVSLNLDYILLTRGADGITLIGADATVHCPASAREVFDVSGAGDTVIASLAAGRIAGMEQADLLHFANVAAGLVVARVGTVAVDRPAVLNELQERSGDLRQRVYSDETLSELVREWRDRSEKIVFTNGCFDIVHAGHASFLTKAAREGNRLIVAINTDESVRKLKGSGRPVNGEEDRACVIAAMAAVDAVVLFDDDTPLRLIENLRPDVLVKGGDYAKSEVVGGTTVESWGGRVVLVPLVEGRSTSGVIRKIAG